MANGGMTCDPRNTATPTAPADPVQGTADAKIRERECLGRRGAGVSGRAAACVERLCEPRCRPPPATPCPHCGRRPHRTGLTTTVAAVPSRLPAVAWKVIMTGGPTSTGLLKPTCNLTNIAVTNSAEAWNCVEWQTLGTHLISEPIPPAAVDPLAINQAISLGTFVRLAFHGAPGVTGGSWAGWAGWRGATAALHCACPACSAPDPRVAPLPSPSLPSQTAALPAGETALLGGCTVACSLALPVVPPTCHACPHAHRPPLLPACPQQHFSSGRAVVRGRLRR